MTECAEERDFPSGPWTGYYQQSGGKQPQDLELIFHDGVMTGCGRDSTGEFVIKGSYDDSTLEVRWTKKYAAAPNVYFHGYREGKGIWGTWEIPKSKRSGFHIWPLAIGEAESQRAAAAVGLREIRASTFKD